MLAGLSLGTAPAAVLLVGEDVHEAAAVEAFEARPLAPEVDAHGDGVDEVLTRRTGIEPVAVGWIGQLDAARPRAILGSLHATRIEVGGIDQKGATQRTGERRRKTSLR